MSSRQSDLGTDTAPPDTVRRTATPGSGVEPELEAELVAIAGGAGCELVHAEFKGGVLRLFIDRPDRPGGVEIADCERVSRETSALLDVVDFGPSRYVLEVSSPGLDRQLYRPADYRRFTGRRVRMTFRSPDTGAKRTVQGLLESFDEAGPGGGTVTVVESDRDERITLPLEAVEKTRLEIEL